MSTSSDSAEEIVRLSLEGFEVVAKISGSMAKNIAVMLYTMSKDTNKKSKGKTTLTKMLKSNSCLKIFTIQSKDFIDFKKQAKRYGILYSALMNKKENDGLVDLVVREEDAVRVNRVIERYNLTKVDVSEITKILDKAEIEKIKENPDTEKLEIDKEVQEMNTSEDLFNTLMKKQNIKEENENDNPSFISGTEKNSPSENSLKVKDEGNKKEERPSIREELNEIKIKKAEEAKEKVKVKEEINPKQEKVSETKHEQPKKKDKKKERSK